MDQNDLESRIEHTIQIFRVYYKNRHTYYKSLSKEETQKVIKTKLDYIRDLKSRVYLTSNREVFEHLLNDYELYLDESMLHGNIERVCITFKEKVGIRVHKLHKEFNQFHNTINNVDIDILNNKWLYFKKKEIKC